MPEATTCATCNRAVWTTDVDADGHCCDCKATEKPVVVERPSKPSRD